MNVPSEAVGKPWQGGYVFKVGQTKACWDRQKSLRENRPGEPAYAGAEDWEIVRCWPIDDASGCERRFQAWAQTYIRNVGPFADRYGVRRGELYVLEAVGLFSGPLPSTEDTMHDEIAEAARTAILARLDDGSIPR